jgi:hypothetical protein
MQIFMCTSDPSFSFMYAYKCLCVFPLALVFIYQNRKFKHTFIFSFIFFEYFILLFSSSVLSREHNKNRNTFGAIEA